MAALTVNQTLADPTSATASVNPICNGGSTALTLDGGGGGTGETIQWYAGSCGGTAAGTGNGLSVSPTTTTTYYGRYEDGAPCSYNSACASVTVTVNALPTAPNITVTRAPGISLKISIADVGATGSGTVSFSSVSGGSQGATITESGSYIFYLPESGNNNNDSLSYTTADDNCTSQSGTITVNVQVAGGAKANQIAYSAGGVTLVFAGIPGIAYDVQRSATIDFQSYTTLTTTNAPAAGVFSLTDPSPLSPSGYYRLFQH